MDKKIGRLCKIGVFGGFLGIVVAFSGCTAQLQFNRGYERGQKDFYRKNISAYGAGWSLGYMESMQRSDRTKEILDKAPKINTLTPEMPHPIEVEDE